MSKLKGRRMDESDMLQYRLDSLERRLENLESYQHIMIDLLKLQANTNAAQRRPQSPMFEQRERSMGHYAPPPPANNDTLQTTSTTTTSKVKDDEEDKHLSSFDIACMSRRRTVV